MYYGKRVIFQVSISQKQKILPKQNKMYFKVKRWHFIMNLNFSTLALTEFRKKYVANAIMS